MVCPGPYRVSLACKVSQILNAIYSLLSSITLYPAQLQASLSLWLWLSHQQTKEKWELWDGQIDLALNILLLVNEIVTTLCFAANTNGRDDLISSAVNQWFSKKKCLLPWEVSKGTWKSKTRPWLLTKRCRRKIWADSGVPRCWIISLTSKNCANTHLFLSSSFLRTIILATSQQQVNCYPPIITVVWDCPERAGERGPRAGGRGRGPLIPSLPLSSL